MLFSGSDELIDSYPETRIRDRNLMGCLLQSGKLADVGNCSNQF
jgi:hypothetical protein